MTAPSAPIAPALLAWYDQHGRHDLPWKHPRDAYRIWVSEIMLQQTQVATALPYFKRFMARFPDVYALAAADQDEVLALWTGLGYYARARNLHQAAQQLVKSHDGVFPRNVAALTALPGIGRSTAGAIAAMAFDTCAPILDGNARRVLTRLCAVKTCTGARQTENQLWAIAEALTPRERVADYTQAIMDLGATLCVRTQPVCSLCPLTEHCLARAQGLERQLPVPRPKRIRPQRHTRMLIIQGPDGRVLLEKRPPTGIWGGLWCLPQLDADSTAADCHTANRLALPLSDVKQIEEWAEFTHEFTHFSLRMQPVRLFTRVQPEGVNEADLGWFDPSATTALGLAAPVQRLLAALAGASLAPCDHSVHSTQEAPWPAS